VFFRGASLSPFLHNHKLCAKATISYEFVEIRVLTCDLPVKLGENGMKLAARKSLLFLGWRDPITTKDFGP
jgi:hypothetical protein